MAAKNPFRAASRQQERVLEFLWSVYEGLLFPDDSAAIGDNDKKVFARLFQKAERNPLKLPISTIYPVIDVGDVLPYAPRNLSVAASFFKTRRFPKENCSRLKHDKK